LSKYEFTEWFYYTGRYPYKNLIVDGHIKQAYVLNDLRKLNGKYTVVTSNMRGDVTRTDGFQTTEYALSHMQLVYEKNDKEFWEPILKNYVIHNEKDKYGKFIGTI